MEFSFYLAFPLLAAAITSLSRAWMALAAALVIGIAANLIVGPALQARYGAEATDLFLYYWPPDQLAVFAIGFLCFYLWRGMEDGSLQGLASWLDRYGIGTIAFCVAGFAALDFLPTGKSLGDGLRVPMLLVASVLFGLFLITMSRRGGQIAVQPWVARIGTVSFSAYLVHFAVIGYGPDRFPALFAARAEGMAAIGAYAIGYAAIVAITFALSSLTYRWIERPFMAMASRASKRAASATW